MNEIGKRITDLREERDMTKRELAAQLGISESQLSRIESGKTATISSDILVGLAREFDVSADYILSLSPTRENDHILSELRLSETACEKLICREIDGVTLSRLMEQDRFGELIKLSRAYFTDLYAEGVGYRNEILDFGSSFLREHAGEAPNPKDVRLKANDITHAKTKDHEIELTQIQNLVRIILTGAKAQYESEQAETDPAMKRRLANQEFSAHLREIANEVYSMEGSKEERLDYLLDRELEEVKTMTGLPDSFIRSLKPIYKKIILRTGTADQSDLDE